MDYYFGLSSDLHYSGSNINDLRPEKQNNLQILTRITQEKHLCYLLLPGDLVNKTTAMLKIPLEKDELNGFLAFEKEAKKLTQVHYTHGNHDTYVEGIGKLYLNQRVRFHIFLKYKWLDYHRYLIKDYLDLVALQCNPISKINIVKLLLKLCDKRKIIVMFHYDVDLRLNDFPAKDRDKIMQILEPYKDQILFIAHGHVHANYTYNYNGFKVICSGGSGMGLVHIKDDSAKVTFINDLKDNSYIIEMSTGATQIVENLDEAIYS